MGDTNKGIKKTGFASRKIKRHEAITSNIPNAIMHLVNSAFFFASCSEPESWIFFISSISFGQNSTQNCFQKLHFSVILVLCIMPMKKNLHSSLLTKNNIGNVSEEDHFQQKEYLQAVRSFARLTYESVYVIDYSDMSFEYVSENPLFLCGYSPEEVLEMGYEFYFRNVPETDLQLLAQINEAGFDFFRKLRNEEKNLYSITYDFQLINKDKQKVLINHKLTPLFLTSEGKMWKAMCIVSISNHKEAGNVRIQKQGSDEIWLLNPENGNWNKSEKPKLTKREAEILRMHAQGLTINQIAERIFVAPDTVKYYRRRIFERLEVNNMVEALSYAVNSKII